MWLTPRSHLFFIPKMFVRQCLVANEIVDELKRKNNSGVIIKIVFEKAWLTQLEFPVLHDGYDGLLRKMSAVDQKVPEIFFYFYLS